MWTKHAFDRRRGLRRLENLRTPIRKDGGDLIVIFLGDEFVGASFDFGQNRFNPTSLDAILRMQMKFAGNNGFFLGNSACGERQKPTPRKKGQRDSLAVLKKLTSADRGPAAILIRIRP